MDTDTDAPTVTLVVDAPELAAATTETLLRSAYAITHRMTATATRAVADHLRAQRDLIDAELLVRCGPAPRSQS